MEAIASTTFEQKEDAELCLQLDFPLLNSCLPKYGLAIGYSDDAEKAAYIECALPRFAR